MALVKLSSVRKTGFPYSYHSRHELAATSNNITCNLINILYTDASVGIQECYAEPRRLNLLLLH